MSAIFLSQISQNPPQIWTDFFDEINARINPFTVVEDYLVLKVKDSPALRSAIVSDERLRKLILKGEQFHFLVKRKDYPTVQKIMLQYGFIVE